MQAYISKLPFQLRPSRLPQKLRPRRQAPDLVGAAFDLVFVVGEMDIPDHGATLEHSGGALQLDILDQRDTVALGEQRAVGILDSVSILP